MTPARSHRPTRPRQSGVTLTGIMVGLAVGSLILSGALSVYLMIARGARDNIRQARLEQELRAAMDVMQQDIRRAGYWDFGDTSQDGDADGDGRFSWQDLGTDSDGAGRFDTDGDGDTDDQDLAPTSNPFQRGYGTINDDLCIGTDSATGACTAATCTDSGPDGNCLSEVQSGNCITFAYDLDQDGRIGVRACASDEDETDCPRPTAAPFDQTGNAPYAWRSWYPPQETKKTKDIEMELFGYRLRKGAIEMRVGWTDRKDISFGCGSGRWEAITSAGIQITELAFGLTTQTRNLAPHKAGSAACATGDPCRQTRSVGIRISGRLADEPDVRQALSGLVAVRNDRYVLTP